GSLATTGDQTPGEGWVMWPEVPVGSANPERAATDGSGSVLFNIAPDTAPAASDETLVNLFEISQAGYSLLGAGCVGATDNGTSNGLDAVSGIIVGSEDVVECTFINASDSVTGG
ncbi:hypothetical protein ACFLRH_00955, partial [Actinomycetota bacterium]